MALLLGGVGGGVSKGLDRVVGVRADGWATNVVRSYSRSGVSFGAVALGLEGFR